MEILEIIHKLRQTGGANAKKVILFEHQDNDEWLAYLNEVYNPFILYGKTGDKTGGRDDLENLKLCRSIDAGVTEVTINKVYPGLIPTASKMMKAKDNCVEAVKYPLWAGIKYDGNYTNIIVKDKKARFFSSGGHEYEVRDDHPFDGCADAIYLAERIWGPGKLGMRRKCNLKGSRPFQYSEGHNFKVFDIISHVAFDADKATVPYRMRKGAVPIQVGIENTAEERLIHNREELDAYSKEVVNAGYEGLVLKQPDMLWRNSTSRRMDFIKHKHRKTADLLCIEEIPGEGDLDGLIGSLKLVDSVGRIVNVGSGLDDLSDRTEWGQFIGKVIEIEYEQIMDTYVQGVYIDRRLDKTADQID